MLTILEFWSYDGLKLTELISIEISGIKQSGDQRLSPDAPFSRTFSQSTSSPYSAPPISYYFVYFVENRCLNTQLLPGPLGRTLSDLVDGVLTESVVAL